MRPQYSLPIGFCVQLDYKKLKRNKRVSFAKQNKVHLFDATATPSIMLTYVSGADRDDLSEQDQCKAGLPILRPSTQQVGVANGGTSKEKYVTQLPFCKLSAQLMQADTFQNFPTPLMSVGRTSNNGMVPVFTKEGVNVFKEEDALITCKGEPILISIQYNQGQYQIPLMHQRGHWQPQRPSKQVRKALRPSQQCLQSPID
jgi:hypothetical protein